MTPITPLANSLYMPLTMLAAVSLDFIFGEPRHFHPLVGLGWLVRRLEHLLYGAASSRMNYVRGIAAVLLLLVPLVAFAAWLQSLVIIGTIFSVVVLYFAIAPRSLREHAENVARALQANDLPSARSAVGRIVSRDTMQLDETGVATATVESVLENGNDAVFAALFWFAVAGAPGVLLYRVSNTLDAMWGYRNERYNYFGWAAARLDDLLNLIPARLTALSYALLGHTSGALRCWRKQASTWDSPNAGPVMAAGAGALQVRLGGAAIYQGKRHERPTLGCGAPAKCNDITRALRLIQHTLWLWLLFIVGAALFAETLHA